ncbi:hypothetical protein ACVWZR_006429 [Bradyrhizobium sp. i1.3.1]
MLSTLDRAATFEQISDALDQLAVPRLQETIAGGPAITSLGSATMGRASAVDAFAGSFAALCAANPQVYAAASFWWTAGGEGFPPMALSCRGLPDPFHYITLLTGDLGHAASGNG